MKKIVLWFVVIVLVAGVSVAMFMRSAQESQEVALKPIEDPAFLYINLEQLVEKGAFEKCVTPENRSFIAAALSSKLQGEEHVEYLKSVIMNLDTLGIDTQTPIYGYINDNLTDYAVVAKVLDVAKVDRFIDFVSYVLEHNNQSGIEVVIDGDARTFVYEGVAVAYNASVLALAYGSDSALNVAKEAISRPQMDMSVFGGSDIALLINADKYIQLASVQINQAMVELARRYDAGEISMERFSAQVEALADRDELIMSYANYFEQNANVMLTATFDLGRMALKYSATGIDVGEYAGMNKPVNLEHLNHLSKDSYAIASVGVDGMLLAKFVREMLDGDMLRSMGITPTNEVNMFVSIACDALSTINGGVTLAVEEIDGEIKSRYNHYWNEYSIEPAIKSVKTMIMADVTDRYIISNIAQFGGGFLRKVDDTHYTLQLLNYNFAMGQDDNLFYLGVNMTPKLLSPSALDVEWVEDVKDAISYVVVNVDELMSSRFMESTNKYITAQLYEEYREVYIRATEVVDYIYAMTNGAESAEVVVVFDDKGVNALEQVNSLVVPTLISKCVKSLH